MKPNVLLMLQAGALAVFLAGMLSSIAAIRANTIVSQQIRDKIETLAQLTAIKQTRDRHQAALRAFEGLSNAVPVPLANLCRSAVTNATPEIRDRESRNLAAGWTLRQVEVVFSELNLSQAPDLLLATEAQRPPWRLTECAIASSRQADGLGRVVLVLEAVGKGGESGGRKQTSNVQHPTPNVE